MLLDLLSCVPRQIQCQSFAVPVGDYNAATCQQHCVAFIEHGFLECAWSVPQCARCFRPCCVRQRYVVSEQKLTWTIESHSRMLARNLLPRPSPVLAPLTRPAMSTNSMLVGTSFFDFDRSLNICGHGRLCCCICSVRIKESLTCNLSSGTATTPMLGSMVQNGKFAACAFAFLQMALNKVDCKHKIVFFCMLHEQALRGQKFQGNQVAL